MGSSEGFTDADKNLALALKSGGWVLLRNVHLCPEWYVRWVKLHPVIVYVFFFNVWNLFFVFSAGVVTLP